LEVLEAAVIYFDTHYAFGQLGALHDNLRKT